MEAKQFKRRSAVRGKQRVTKTEARSRSDVYDSFVADYQLKRAYFVGTLEVLRRNVDVLLSGELSKEDKTQLSELVSKISKCEAEIEELDESFKQNQ